MIHIVVRVKDVVTDEVTIENVHEHLDEENAFSSDYVVRWKHGAENHVMRVFRHIRHRGRWPLIERAVVEIVDRFRFLQSEEHKTR